MAALEDVIRKARPLFIAFDKAGSLKKRKRGRLFGNVVRTSSDIHSVMVLEIDGKAMKALTTERPTKRNIARALAKLFPEIADLVPPVRKAWQDEPAGLGIFMALGAAVVGWGGLRRKD